jgi:hypothetical protein
MVQAGFIDVVQLGKTPVQTSEYTVGAMFQARKLQR